MTIEFLNNHDPNSGYTGGKLDELFDQSTEEIFIVVPYISMNPLINKISDSKVGKVNILTRFSLHDFVTGASDLAVIKQLSMMGHVNIRYFSNLHAKVYLFDSKQAVITSANFTANGLFRNLEYGVLVDEGIEQLSQELLELWGRAEAVNEQLMLCIEQELSVIDETKKVASKVRKEISIVNDKIINKNISHQIQKKSANLEQTTKVVEEYQALNIVIERCKLSEVDAGKIKMVYDTIKRNIPEEIQEKCSFRYLLENNRANIACNVMNYRLFLFPYSKNNLVQLIYPRNKLSNLLSIVPEERLKNSEDWIFKSFECELLRISMDEFLKLEPIHWQSFKDACFMAVNAKKTRYRETNMRINWDDQKEIYFYIQAVRGADAIGKLVDKGFVVLKGSMAAKEIAQSFPKQKYYESRQKVINEKVLIEVENQLSFTKDYMFNSPSEAASVVMGRNATGQSDWKLDDGTCLRDYLQKNQKNDFEVHF